ncbi:DUF6034 family protein [Lachnospiraceae bacterium 45-P1]
MRRKQKVETKGRKKILAVLLAGAITGILPGCVRQTDTPIVSVKTEQFQENQGGYQEISEEGSEDEKTIREQAEAPETYTLDIRREDMTIMGSVNVEVPEGNGIPEAEVQYTPYTDEELEKIKAVLEEEAGITQWSLKSQENPVTYTSQDETYVLSLAKGSKGSTGDMPMVWLSCSDISDGRSTKGDENDLSDFSMPEDDRLRFQKDMEERAEILMEKMGMKDFCLEDARWRPLSVSRNYTWHQSGEYGIHLSYGRMVGDMPLVNSQRGYTMSEALAPAQYVEFLYGEDGRLLSVKNIGREQIRVTSGHTKFLLPFASVCQVFEQCMKTLQTDWGAGAEAFQEEELPGTNPHLYLTVTDVKLAYRLEYDEWDPKTFEIGGGKGKLVPVCAFYGKVRRGYEDQNRAEAKKVLLLMVNAENGTIYGQE